MHIPDGYLGPQTYGAAYAVMIPLWTWASSRVRKKLRVRQVPLMALGAAFSFVIMMFNIPIPGGTTGHAVGAVLVAVLLGPWAAVVAISVALAVQALIFGDGGLTAFAANCFNMAVVMPFAGYWTFVLLSKRDGKSPRRDSLAAAAAGYVGLNAAALATALEFGIQPLIAFDAAGRALYCPFGLEIAVPAMALEHILFFGFVEAAVTGAAYAYIARTEPHLLVPPACESGGGAGPAEPRSTRKWALILGAMVLLSPLGLYLPARFGAGSAWGEWSAEEIEKLAGYVPGGLKRLGALWEAPLPGYALSGQEQASPLSQGLVYVAAGLLGVLVVAGILLAIQRGLVRRETP
jgi:cobalt/nickel transport system permease protein